MIEIKQPYVEQCDEVKFIQVWTAHAATNEFGSNGAVVGYFSSYAAAENAVEGQGWYGGRGNVVGNDAVAINGKVYLLKRTDPIDLDQNQKIKDEALRQKTIASLTAEQRRVLGLK